MKLILEAIKALFRKIEISLAHFKADMLSRIDNAQSTANSKMDANNPVGTGSFSMGRKSGSVIGDFSHAEGSNTTASGKYSHAEGNITTASNYYSHAEGSNTTASGEKSHAEGGRTTASGYASHAEGEYTKASGYASHAEGTHTTASGGKSHAEGIWTTASSDYQHVQGKFNVEDSQGKYAHIVGNGVNGSNRSNAHTLDWNGNTWYAGDVYVGSTSGVNKDEGSKKLATEEYVDSKQVQSDWNQNNETAEDYIKNKPLIATNDDAMDLLAEIGIITPITNSNGEILTSSSNEIYSL